VGWIVVVVVVGGAGVDDVVEIWRAEGCQHEHVSGGGGAMGCWSDGDGGIIAVAI